ncbi:hypothetical protein, partial [Thermococcus sp. M36]|uniref:hypothetical protein n=1 Tax=Thermococcus sp. M36 TaxID=1638261 RepID=UPI00197EF458
TGVKLQPLGNLILLFSICSTVWALLTMVRKQAMAKKIFLMLLCFCKTNSYMRNMKVIKR